METAQSLGDDTCGGHAATVGVRGRAARCVCVFFFVLVGSELGASTCTQTMTRAKVNVRPRPLVNQQASKQRKTKDE